MSVVSSRISLLAGTAFLHLAAVPLNAAWANEADNANAAITASAEEAGEFDIVVTGIRASLSQALNVKRNSDLIVDAISSEDVGKFPDTNIAESVQRISGVQINRTRGEGRTVNIRGLPSSFTLVTLNGRTVPNALYGSGNSRSFDFSILPPEFVGTLEVYKSPSANTEDGGLSGVVNIKTVRAFDLKKSLFAVSAQGQYETNSGKIAPKLSAVYADTFLDERLGVSLGVSYNRRRSETHQNEVNYTTVTEGAGLRSTGPLDINGDGVIEADRRFRIPEGIFYTIYDEDIERKSAIGSIDFRATDTLTLSTDVFYSDLTVRSLRNPSNNNFYGASRVISAETEMLGGIETVTRFEVDGLDVRNNGRLEDSDGYLFSTNVGAEYKNEGWTLNLSGAYGRSREENTRLNIANVIYGPATFIAKPGDQVASIIYSGAFKEGSQDPNAANIVNLNGEYEKESTDVQYEARFDLKHEWSDGPLKAVAFGAKYVDRTKYQDNSILSITPAGLSTLFGGLPAGTLPGTISASEFMQPLKPGSGSFLGSYKGDAIFPGNWLTADTRGALEGLSRDQLLAVGRLTNDATGITDVKEKTLAFYGRGDFEFGKLSGNIGLRAVRTSQETVGVAPDLTGITYEIGGGFTRVPSAEPTTVKRSYWDFLPSLNLKLDAADDVVVRFGASRTMARPNLGEISPTVSANSTQRTITANNPELEPFRATNIDLSAEWYFSKTGLVSASFFYKDIESLIRSEVSEVTLPLTNIWPDGSSTISELTFQQNRLVNGEGVTVKGVELGYQQAFTFLPAPFDGLGTILNYTFIDNNRPDQLTAASKHNFNATGYYEKGPVGVRLSYSWRSSNLTKTAVAPLMSATSRAFGTLDGSINVKVTDAASLIFEAVNITDADNSSYYDTGLPEGYVDFGRRYTLGFRARF